MRELLDQVAGQGELYYAWASINEAGHYNRSHTHSGPWTRSGIYVVHADEDSGATVFESQDEEIIVQPAPGLMMVFPAALVHRVEPTRAGQRITIAWNFV